MAEEEKSQAQPEETGGSEEHKKESNKSFTQSEHDKALKKELAKEREKLRNEVREELTKEIGDLTEIKSLQTELKTAREAKEKAEQDKLSDVQKMEMAIQEAINQNQELAQQNEQFRIEQTKASVLNDPRYSVLPRVYREKIQGGTDPNIVAASAEELLAEYQKDMETVASKNIGKAIPGGAGKIEFDFKPSIDQQANMLKQNVLAKINGLGKPV
jgi:hypothetical protein